VVEVVMVGGADVVKPWGPVKTTMTYTVEAQVPVG
jgi:hypothetical protein